MEKWVRKASGVCGFLQENGDFIFYVDDDNYKKMVLTSNTGSFLQAGYLDINATNWEDSTKWKHADWYKVDNFKPSTGMKM